MMVDGLWFRHPMNLIEPSTVLSEEESLRVLSRTLVICPVYSRPEPTTDKLLALLETCGASTSVSKGISDIALHRCMLACSTQKALQKHPRKWDAVVWLDGDMAASPQHVAVLAHLAHKHACCISGLYAKKSASCAWCAKPVDADPLQTELGALPAVSVGLGCLAIDALVFEQLCELGEGFTVKGEDDLDRIPALFQSCLVQLLDGSVEWQSEDLFFCSQTWKNGVGIYLAPIAFGHVTPLAVLPEPDGTWLAGTVKPELQP